MMRDWIAHIIRFLLLALFQAFLLNNIGQNLGGWVNPQLYILALLLLPIELPVWAGLGIGFFYGLFMDSFFSTPGLHASACVSLMFARVYLLQIFAPREGYELGSEPSLQQRGWAWFISYAGLSILIHHAWLFYVEQWKIDNLWSIMGKTLCSAVFSLLLILVSQYFSFKPKK